MNPIQRSPTAARSIGSATAPIAVARPSGTIRARIAAIASSPMLASSSACRRSGAKATANAMVTRPRTRPSRASTRIRAIPRRVATTRVATVPVR